MLTDLDRARDALNAIDPGCSREEWHLVGRSAIAAGLSVDVIDDWSSRASNYKGTKDVRAAFKNITPDGGTGAGTLFHRARAEGWRDTGNGAGRTAPAKAATRPAEPRKAPRPGESAAEVWARCEPATAAHDYIVKKDGRPDGLRVVPEGDPLRIAGHTVADWLVVPVMPLYGGEPASLQFIPPPGAGKKLNLPSAPMAGVFIVGEVVAGGTAYLCEGIGQAWACWKATGAAAVVCFGWGRVRGVAAELRQRDPSARLVLVPDAGKEAEAETIAREVATEFVTMPVGSPQNLDANDYAATNGHDALEVLLSRAAAPAKPEPPTHPLARFVDFDGEPMAPRWVIPGFIGHGVTIIAGAHGVGKTTTLLPLAMVAAGLHKAGDPLAPLHWRHVVYIVEDVEQARRILAGMVKFGGLGLDAGAVRERLHLVEARRLEPAFVAEVGKTYREQFARSVDGVDVLPLVVVDTKAATLNLDNENDNSEASRAMATLKQGFDGLPTWLVGHVAKPIIGRTDAMSLRGGSAWEADANQVLYLVKEQDGTRYLVRGKTRFEARWTDLHISTAWQEIMARDEFGNTEAVTLRWAIVSPPEQSRKEAQDQAQEATRKADAAAMRDEVRHVIDVAWMGGCPLNRAGVKAKVKRRDEDVVACIENLLSERWLHEVDVPANVRTNVNRKVFLVNLTTEEHEAAVRGEGMPAAKLVVPESWRKPAAPFVPEPMPQKEEEAAHASAD